MTNVGYLQDRSSTFNEVAKEWEQNNWVELAWFIIPNCIEGWEPIVTLLELKRTKFKHSGILEKPVMMCGRRGKYNFLKTERTSASKNFTCTNGGKPCSADPNKSGSTYCVDLYEECPITFLKVYDRGSLSIE